MLGNQTTREQMTKSLSAAFIDSEIEHEDRLGYKLLANTKKTGDTLLSSIKRELNECDSFDFAVAFVTPGGLACLVQVLAELRSRGVKGRLLTSTYQDFNSPEVFSKLLEYENLSVRVYEGPLHAKGYVFDKNEISTVIVGSSNLTQQALTCNREWNVLFRSYPGGGMLKSVKAEYETLWSDANTTKLTKSWIEGYKKRRIAPELQNKRAGANLNELESAVGNENHCLPHATKAMPLKPNSMQEKALEALRVLHSHGEQRALLVSATGTGKTYLSAFDVLNVKPKRVLFLAHRKKILSASLNSYKKLLGNLYTYKMYSAKDDESTATCVFAMCSTVCKHLDEFKQDEFDYIVIDEAHRTGSKGYQEIIEYFTPHFFLGMTATPNRTDGYDVFALFNHVIAYSITLQDALANNMLAPFHYYGIADLSIDYEETDDVALFNRLTSNERVRQIVNKIEEYSVEKENRRGLIFCNRNEEAQELSKKFNELGYQTVALSGKNSDEERDRQIERLEAGELQYIFSVDILNEGVDIPSINQIIMLRRTESAIVFVQQLGRGLRKCEETGKEYVLVLDFIGNYQKNFFVPVALSGDKTFNKDRLRTIVNDGTAIIPGASTVSFDRVAASRIFRAIDGGDFGSAKFLRGEYLDLRQMLGRIPTLEDYDKNGAIDPLLLFKKYGSYHVFLSKYEKDYGITFDDKQVNTLKFLSQKLACGKRFEDLLMLRELLDGEETTAQKLLHIAKSTYKVAASKRAVASASAVLYGSFLPLGKGMPLVFGDENGYRLTREFSDALKNAEFKRQVLEILDFGIRRHFESYGEPYKDTSFVLYAKYTYEEVCRLLGWEKNVNGQNIGGYMYNESTNTFPVFINYDKAPEVSDSIRYEDRFISCDELIAISKQGRSLHSPEIERLKAWPDNKVKTYLFMRKNKNDEGSKEFYFLGEMYPTGDFKQITMEAAGKRAVEIRYRLDVPVRHDIYEFMLSDLSEA